MSSPSELIFFVNGKKVVEKNADPEEVLLSFLRRRAGLTGTKYGCGSGGCGACTVMVSRYSHHQERVVHYTVNACLQQIVTLHCAAVVTVEGIGSTKTKLHPVQVEGGFVQGVGLYTIEELQFSPDGVLMTRGPSQYKVPSLCDVPAEFNVHLLADSKNPHAIYLSKGIGEPPVFFGSTLFFAIKAAIAEARKEKGLGDTFPLSSPATAEKIRMACQDQFTEMASSQMDGTATPWCIQV